MVRCSLKFWIITLLWTGAIVSLRIILSRSQIDRYITSVTSSGAVLRGSPIRGDNVRAEVGVMPRFRIPRLLHLATQSEMVLDAFRASMASCARLHPAWTIYLWTNEDVELLLRRRQPDLLDLYRQLGSQSERLELAKYPILYYMGGVMLEPDMECLQPLTAVVDDPATMGAFLSEERAENVMVYENRMFRLSPAVMGAEPGHHFFAYAVDILLGKVPIEDMSLSQNFLTVCYRQWLTEDRNRSTPVAVLPSELFSPSLRDPQTLRQLCRYHRGANLSSVYQARERGCALIEGSMVDFTDDRRRNFTDRTVGVHHHVQLEWLTRLHRLLHPAANSTDDGGKFNVTEVLSAARRYSWSQRADNSL